MGVTVKEIEKSIRALKRGTGFWKAFSKAQRTKIIQRWEPNYKPRRKRGKK